MTVEELIRHLQGIQAEHPGCPVVVGRDYREYDEVPLSEAPSWQEGDEEGGLGGRAVIWAVG